MGVFWVCFGDVLGHVGNMLGKLPRLQSRHTIRNRDSSRSCFVTFPARVKELVNSDSRFGFCIKNNIYIYKKLAENV